MAALPAIGAIGGLVSGGFGVYSAIEGSNARADAAAKQAELMRLQAVENDRRLAEELALVDEQERIVSGEQRVRFSTSGTDLNSRLAILNKTRELAMRERKRISSAAQFRSEQIRAGADITEELGRRESRAGMFEAIGLGISTGTGFIKTIDPKTGSFFQY